MTDLTEFEKLLLSDGLRADDPRLGRYVYPAGQYQAKITGVTREATKPAADSGKEPSPFFKVTVKLLKPISVDPSRKAEADAACEYGPEAERAYYITPKAFPFWVDLAKSCGLGDKNPITEVPRALIGKSVVVGMTEEKTKNGNIINGRDVVIEGVGK